MHFLLKNFEDAFGDETVATTAEKMAGKFGVWLNLAATEVRWLRGKEKNVASTLANRWRQETGHDFNKVKLSEPLVSLVGSNPPPDINKTLEAAAAHFESGAGPPSRTGQLTNLDTGLPHPCPYEPWRRRLHMLCTLP